MPGDPGRLATASRQPTGAETHAEADRASTAGGGAASARAALPSHGHERGALGSGPDAACSARARSRSRRRALLCRAMISAIHESTAENLSGVEAAGLSGPPAAGLEAAEQPLAGRTDALEVRSNELLTHLLFATGRAGCVVFTGCGPF